MKTLTYRRVEHVDDLLDGPADTCVLRLCQSESATYWRLCAVVRHPRNGAFVLLSVPVNPGGPPLEHGPGREKLWGFERGGTSDGWQVSPSVDVPVVGFHEYLWIQAELTDFPAGFRARL